MDESPTWPRRFVGPILKPTKSARTAEKQRRRRLVVQRERDNKLEAKRRDHYRCRFPFCGCRLHGLTPEVAHLTHKGTGGDPKGLRSHVDNLITLCGWRHREAPVSLHKGTLRVVPRTAAGTNGPVSWLLDVGAYTGMHEHTYWILLGREERVGVLEPVEQTVTLEILEKLSRMER